MANETSRRSLLKNAAVATGAIGTAAVMPGVARASHTKGSKLLPLEKKAYPPPTEGEVKLFNSAVSFGNLLCLCLSIHFNRMSDVKFR